MGGVEHQRGRGAGPHPRPARGTGRTDPARRRPTARNPRLMATPVIPMLGDVELRTIQHITTLERRALVEHRVPGMTGSAFQDLGRPSARVQLEGVLFGEEAGADLEKLRTKFQSAEPVSFAADISTATQIVDVLIEDLRVVELA